MWMLALVVIGVVALLGAMALALFPPAEDEGKKKRRPKATTPSSQWESAGSDRRSAR